MPLLGPLELIAVAVIALIAFGPEKLPELARSIAKTLGELRRAAAEARSEFESGLRLDEPEEPVAPKPVTPSSDPPGPETPRPETPAP